MHARAHTHTHARVHTHTQEHVLAKKWLVSTLIQFYVDIEIMGREFDGGRCSFLKCDSLCVCHDVVCPHVCA